MFEYIKMAFTDLITKGNVGKGTCEIKGSAEHSLKTTGLKAIEKIHDTSPS
jgi:hypothetical protein